MYIHGYHKMLSDSIFEALEDLFQAVENYDYSVDFKDELIEAMTILRTIQWKLDHIEKIDAWARKKIDESVCNEFNEALQRGA